MRPVDDRVDLARSPASAGGRACRPTSWVARAIFSYARHYATDARCNHAHKSGRDAALVSLDLSAMFDVTTPAQINFRPSDRAVGVLVDCSGPITGYRRGLNILTTNTGPRPPC